MRTLVVEDDLTSRRLMQKIFSEFGETSTAVNGVDALGIYQKSLDEGTPFDLICMDIMMPEMDGQTALKEIRLLEEKSGAIEGIKIIMTTALADAKNVIDAFREQCDGYLVKPIDKNKIMEKLQELDLLSTA